MDGWDDNSVISDWPPTSISNFLNDEFSLKFNPLIADDHDVPRMKTDKQKLNSLTDREDDGFQFFSGPSVEISKFDIHKPITCSGLSERRPAWSGFTMPKINTTRIISTKLDSTTSEVRSPYLTISPGLSPTTLLDSPKLLSNLAQLSPTTGKLSYNNYNNTELVSTTGIADKAGDHHTLEEVPESFAFKSHPEPNSSYFSSADNKQPLTSVGATAIPFQNNLNLQTAISNSSDISNPLEKVIDSFLSSDHTLPLNDQKDAEVITAEQAEDGYSWWKYGEKQVKGSDYPRSYYRCAHLNCPIKKKVEQSHEHRITKIIYKGAHNHIKCPPNHWVIAPDSYENMASTIDLDGNLLTTTSQDDNQCATSEFGDPSMSSDDDDDWGAYDGERDETESKRRKIDASVIDMSAAPSGAREPRVVVQTASETDILDDGYRWRKYGQKVVKGNPNPRSYYKCTSPGCSVRKHVERASNDLKSVITSYEGKHNHDIPVARGNNHSNSASSMATTSAISRPQVLRRRPELTLAQDSLTTSNGFSLAIRQQGLNNLGVMELSMGTPMKISELHRVHPLLSVSGQYHRVNDTKQRTNQMPLEDSGQTKPNAAVSLVYHQMINRLHLGNHQQ
ncbi:putative transcription factor WRKY family [Dioscorea sansibarensis]